MSAFFMNPSTLPVFGQHPPLSPVWTSHLEGAHHQYGRAMNAVGIIRCERRKHVCLCQVTQVVCEESGDRFASPCTLRRQGGPCTYDVHLWYYINLNTGVSSLLRAKLCDWAARPLWAGCYYCEALSSTDLKTRYKFGHRYYATF